MGIYTVNYPQSDLNVLALQNPVYQRYQNYLPINPIYNPGILDPGAVSTPPVTAPPPGLPSDVSVALASIPIAQDGFVVTADFHNSLRAAIVAMAGFLGDGAVNQLAALTLAPAFLPVPGQDSEAPWDVGPDGAIPGSTASAGWMPVELPDGSSLRTLSVISTPQSTLTKLEVRLSRVPIEGGSMTDLFKASRTTGAGSVATDTAQLAVSGITSAAALDDFRRVSNGSYRYVIQAHMTGGTTTPLAAGTPFGVKIHSLQVGYTRW